MSDGFTTPEAGRPAGSEQEVVETVRRIMGEPGSGPASPAEDPGPGQYVPGQYVPGQYAPSQYAPSQYAPAQQTGSGTPAPPATAAGLTAGTSNGPSSGGQGNGSQGNGSQGNGSQGNGSQGNGSQGNGSQQPTEVAKEQAGDVADSAKQAGTQVAQTVKEQAAGVTNEAGRQAKELLMEAQSELSDQAAQQQQKVAGGLHALANELDGMVRGSEQDGVATDLARQAADKARQIGAWLEDRDPGSLLDEVRDFGRRRPGTYLAIAAGAGILAGRLARGLSASSDSIPTQSTRSGTRVDHPVQVAAAREPETLTSGYPPAETTAGQSLEFDRGGYPHGAAQGDLTR